MNTESKAFFDRMQKLSIAQHDQVKHIFNLVLNIVENPHLPAVLMHAIDITDSQTNKDMCYVSVTAHCLSADPREVDNMLVNYVTAKVSGNVESLDQPRH